MVNTYFFYIFINVCKGRGYGDLATNIVSTNEKPFTNTISNQPTILILMLSNFSMEPVYRRFKASRASHGWEAASNHMWPDKPVRQAREPSEEFVG